MANCIFETSKNCVISHRRHIYQTSPYMDTATMCVCPSSLYELIHCKCVLHCCAKYPCIDISNQESDKNKSMICPKIHFHVYNLVSHCTVNVWRALAENKHCRLCSGVPKYMPNAKIFPRKYIVMIETYITYFHTSFYIPEIKNLALHLIHVRML